METTLHQELKEFYRSETALCEQQLEGYRIDVLDGGHVIEIQCSSLAAIRDKVRDLAPQYELTLVKPIVRRRYVIKRRYSKTLGRHMSRTVGDWLDAFEELVHFVTVFPQPQLTLELLLVDIEEIQRPPRKRWSRKGYRVEDRRLVEVADKRQLREAVDLLSLLPVPVPEEFSTAELAKVLQQPRWVAQKIAYCLRESGAVDVIGKSGNAILYRAPAQVARAA